MYALLPNYRHSVFDTVHAIGDFREVILAQGLLLSIERAIVAASNLKIVSEKQRINTSANPE